MGNSNDGNKEVFLQGNDALALDINANANELFYQLQHFDLSRLTVADEYKNYFINHHLGNRLFFSLQSSAHIIYYSVKKCSKPVNEITFIDYGAGLGTLFMLAGMMGFKKIVYNDYLPDWHQPAKALCSAFNIKIDEYVTGDIDNVVKHAGANNIQYDIIASRNVIEHIYSLPHFYQSIFRHNKNTVTYSTTTANYHNPAMRWYHIYIHKKADRDIYRRQRIKEIKKLQPSLKEEDVNMLAKITRGRALGDFTDAVNNFIDKKIVVSDPTLRTNTCDCNTGLWIEHLLTEKEHQSFATAAGFKFEYTAGFCDTHYKYSVINMLAILLNKIISLLGEKKGVVLSPFVNITAYN